MRIILIILVFIGLGLSSGTAEAQKQVARVLWWNGMPDYPPQMYGTQREEMARYVDNFGGGQVFSVMYRANQRGGALAREIGSGQYDILVLDITTSRANLNGADTSALQQFYASGRSALMLDGSFWIRNTLIDARTQFPGENGGTAGLLINQLSVLAEAGGGILIGADHNAWQPGANKALQALIPGARFTGTTNPSTDGAFIGNALLAKRVPVTARDILRHWEAVPNQGEAPVGQFQDFMGRTVTLYSLVETSDKPGGKRKRPYISASVFPGEGQTAIDSDQSAIDNIPTHKSGNN